MGSDIIKISHLNKSFGEVKAVNDLSFRVKKGELFAFLGVNGAGKSTTISILCGLQKKDSGTVQVNGIETDKAGEQTKVYKKENGISPEAQREIVDILMREKRKNRDNNV